jgi:predicted kinase
MLNLKSETLYLLSGVQASGKSTFTRNLRYRYVDELRPLPEGMVQSSDAMRRMLFGTRTVVDGNLSYREPRHTDDTAMFAVLMQAVESRMQQRLTTFIDAMSLTEEDRNSFAKVARKHQMDVELLLFDVSLEEALARNAKREFRVPDHSVEYAYNRLMRESALPTQIVTPEMALQHHVVEERRVIPENFGLDVICDLHGLLPQFLELAQKTGYVLVDGLPVHPDGRKMLFLGDIIDRGDHSIDLLDLVRRMVEKGLAYAIKGNHEEKLLSFLHQHEQCDLKTWNSAASANTGLDLLRRGGDFRGRLVNFIKSMPGYYVRGRVAFVHADIGREFVPGDFAMEDCLYGIRKAGFDTDSDAMTRLANKHYWIVRGHIPETSPGLGTVTVYDDGEFGGRLVALSLPEGPVKSAEHLQELASNMTYLETNFDYEKVIEARSPLRRNLDKLVKEGKVTKNLDSRYGFSLYKYAASVFYDNLWGEHEALARARGIVFDIAGNVIQNPFTKVYNLGENNTTEDPDKLVVAAEKHNGFLVCVSYHPVEENDLLVTTTGSFNSAFVKLAEKYIKDQRAFGPLLRALRNRRDLTLMFELVHSGLDPHIVQYNEEDFGLYLIGARNCAENAMEWTEARLDELAEEIGPNVRRGKWEVIRFGDLLAKARAAENFEGWMWRDNDEVQRICGKLKTPWYLTTKFIGRMNEGNVKFLFTRPEAFKKKIDEEFFPLVDRLVQTTTAVDYLAMSQSERVALVAALTQPEVAVVEAA